MKWSRYGIYHLRWQLSSLVMMPLMLLLESHLPLWLNLPIGQAFGAAMFYCVDKRIFKNND